MVLWGFLTVVLYYIVAEWGGGGVKLGDWGCGACARLMLVACAYSDVCARMMCIACMRTLDWRALFAWRTVHGVRSDSHFD